MEAPNTIRILCFLEKFSPVVVEEIRGCTVHGQYDGRITRQKRVSGNEGRASDSYSHSDQKSPPCHHARLHGEDLAVLRMECEHSDGLNHRIDRNGNKA